MISTITVNYKTADYLEKMLESLFAHHKDGNIEVIVVENGSGDDISKVQNRFPSAQFVISQQNLGFAGGCNLGLESATGDFVVLVNPDVIFTEPALYRIAQKMKDDISIGIGGISLKNLDGTQQKCVWRFPTPFDQALLLLKIHHLFPSISPIQKWKMDYFNYTQSADVDQVMGAFFCIRKDVLEQVGTLDSEFFMWYEEVDFCRRAVSAGWRVRYFADICVKHKLGSSFDRVPTIQKQAVLRRSVRRYIRKHYGRFVGFWFWFFEPIFALLSVIASKVKPI